MQVAGSVQPCAHVKDVHAEEHSQVLATQESEAHSLFFEQRAPATFFVHLSSAPMAVHMFDLHMPFTVQSEPNGFPAHIPLRQMVEMQPALIVQDEPLGNAAQHTFCWLKSKETE